MQEKIRSGARTWRRIDCTMQRLLQGFESMIMRALVGMMILTIGIATLELGWMLISDLLAPPLDLLSINEMMNLFGFFMMVLIGLELLDTVKSYITEHTIRVEAVFMVAMIAVARKVIIVDAKDLPPLTLIGIAALILSLAAGYWFTAQRRQGRSGKVSGSAPS